MQDELPLPARSAGFEGLVRQRASRLAIKTQTASQRMPATGGGVRIRAGRARVASSSVRTTPCTRSTASAARCLACSTSPSGAVDPNTVYVITPLFKTSSTTSHVPGKRPCILTPSSGDAWTHRISDESGVITGYRARCGTSPYRVVELGGVLDHVLLRFTKTVRMRRRVPAAVGRRAACVIHSPSASSVSAMPATTTTVPATSSRRLSCAQSSTRRRYARRTDIRRISAATSAAMRAMTSMARGDCHLSHGSKHVEEALLRGRVVSSAAGRPCGTGGVASRATCGSRSAS